MAPVTSTIETLGVYPFSIATEYTLASTADALADELSVRMPKVDGDPIDFDMDEEYTLRPARISRKFRVTGQTMAQGGTSISLVSEEANVAFKSFSKDIKFMSMDAMEYDEFIKYMDKFDANMSTLSYSPVIKLYSYNYATVPVGINGGWWAFKAGSNSSSSSIAGYLGQLCGGYTVHTNLPGFKIKQFAVSSGTSYYDALASLFAPFEPLVVLRGNVIYFLDRTRATPLNKTISVKKATGASEQKIYKGDFEEVSITGGLGTFNPLWFEGEVLIDSQYRTEDINTDTSPYNTGSAKLGSVGFLYYGDYIVETTDEYVVDQYWGRIKANTKRTEGGYDAFQASLNNFYTYDADYEYDPRVDGVVKTRETHEYTRYRYLDYRYDTPRIDSSLEGTVIDSLTMENFREVNPATTQNWCVCIRRGALLDDLSDPANRALMFMPDLEWELQWRFYDYKGRMLISRRQVFSVMHCNVPIPSLYTDYADQIFNEQREMQFTPYVNTKPGEGPQGGVIIPLVYGTVDNWLYNPLTWSYLEDIRYIDLGKKMYLEAKVVRQLSNIGTFEVTRSSRIMHSSQLPSQPVRPREASIIRKERNDFKSVGRQLDRPTKIVSMADMWDNESVDSIYARVKKIHGFTGGGDDPRKYVRSFELPFAVVIPKGSRVSMTNPVNDYAGQVILPGRNATGLVTACTITNNGGVAQTTLEVTGAPN